MSELQRLSDPTYAIQLAVGPSLPEFVPQQPHSGLKLAGRFDSKPRRFVFKKAHLSRKDFRVFDYDSGHPVAVMHHWGKNPYGALDPLELSGISNAYDHVGEWESVCTVSGYCGRPSLKIRPKTLSRHGRQYVYEAGSKKAAFNIGKESKIKNMSLRSNLAVRAGEGKDIVYRVLPDLMGRTLQIVTPDKEELVPTSYAGFLEKNLRCRPHAANNQTPGNSPLKVTGVVCTLHTACLCLCRQAALGAGSEMLIDVAAGVDWTAMVAILMAVQQVGAHFLKDALGNFVLDPLKEQAVQGGLQYAGMEGAASSAGQSMDSAIHFVRIAQDLHRMFYS